MGPLNPGEQVPLLSGGYCDIKEYIGSGGVGYIYTVDSKNILKWYKKDKDIQKMKTNIEKLIKEPSPYPNLTWPKTMTQDYKESFGYVMAKIPRGYVSLSTYIYDPHYYLNVEETLQIGYAIAASFHAIHQKNYVYQDINPNGIFIHKELKRVIICDVDNCNKDGIIFVRGTPMYMAPEIVIEMSDPNLYTDYYSLSVILFQLFYMNHPLEGRKTWSKPLSEEDKIEYFGKHPLFVCDPVDDSNGFYLDYTEAVEKRWPIFPAVLKDAFTTAFTIGLKNPEKRLTDQQWMGVIKQSYARFVKKEINARIREGFFPTTTTEYLKINIHGQCILLSEYKKIYGYIFDEEDMFTKVLFECSGHHYITAMSNDFFVNDQPMQKGQRRQLQRHDSIEYHGKKGVIE